MLHHCLTIHRRRLFQLMLSSAVMLAGLSVASPGAANADKFVLSCEGPTPALSSPHYPGASRIILSNNLARPIGKAEDASGQLVFLRGRVVDEKCTPVANAIIDLWQTNPRGEYRFATREELLTPYPHFAGSGRAVTNNLGEYSFITVFPGPNGKQAPHINVRINHPDFSELDTALYFKGDRRNATDPRFLGLRPNARQLLQAEIGLKHQLNPSQGLQATFNIMLKGKSPYRSY